jgi:DNA modification methylase
MSSNDFSKLAIIYRSLEELTPHSSNARTHSRHQIRQIADSVKVFGFTNPVLIDHKNTIIFGHPTVKPVALLADAILDYSARGEIVLDAFLGSGTTLIAAERVGRACFGMEIDPLHVDVAIRRWQRHTGDRALHGVTGKPFDEISPVSEVENGR